MMTLSKKEVIARMQARVEEHEEKLNAALLLIKHLHIRKGAVEPPPEFMRAWKQIFGEKP
jgi:hypothetical protein